MTKATASLATRFGPLGLVEEDGKLTEILWRAQDDGARTPMLDEAVAQLTAYVDGHLTKFDLPLAPKGTSLQQKVYAAMQAIPYGETRTYGDLARDLNAMPQPIGQACGANPIPIIIPCHRITGADSLGGFSAPGGIEQKIALLKHEGAYSLLL